MRIPRALAAGLFLALLLAAPAVRAEEDDHDHDHDHDEEEDPFEHLMEVYDADAGHTLDAAELGALFAAIQEKSAGAAEADAHAGHAHAHEADEAAAEILTVEHILEHYGGHDAVALNESAFLAACPALLRCASEASCEFEHEEETASSSKDGAAHLSLKLGLMAVILVEALVGGLLPLFLIRNLVRADGFMSLLNAFSGGIFLTTGLTHILPHVVESSAEVDHGDYPLPYALVILGYMLIFLVERVLFHSHAHSLESEDEHGHGHGHGDGHGDGHSHSHAHTRLSGDGPLKLPSSSAEGNTAPLVNGVTSDPNKFYNSLVLLLAISLHAVLAGISLGVQGERAQVITVAVAICSHKAPAAFSIGSKFLRDGMSLKHVLALVGAFSLVTPIGIGIGIGVGSARPVAKLVLEGLAAGTFIYVGATEISTDEFETTARACDTSHGAVGKAAKYARDEEGGDHTHRVHAPPGRVARLMAFSAYAAGCVVILLTNLAPHAD